MKVSDGRQKERKKKFVRYKVWYNDLKLVSDLVHYPANRGRNSTRMAGHFNLHFIVKTIGFCSGSSQTPMQMAQNISYLFTAQSEAAAAGDNVVNVLPKHTFEWTIRRIISEYYT